MPPKSSAGLEYIEQRCIKAHGDTLDNLLSLLAEIHTKDDEAPQGLDKLVSELEF